MAPKWDQPPSGGNVTGATSNVLTLTAIALTNAGNYTLVVTNVYGAATSSVASLTVLLPPTITVPPSAQTVQCGSNAAFSVTATGTPPLNYQWTLDSVPLAGATNTGLSLTNVHLPTHTVAVVVTNVYGSATSAVTLTVQDTLPPVLTLNGSNPYYVELGSAFLDPGATAYDLCAGTVPVVATGTVNTNAVSTNTVIYTATDGNGNTNTATRTVLVRDTTPPTILWSFTNLVLAAGTNCTAAMPEVTGTELHSGHRFVGHADPDAGSDQRRGSAAGNQRRGHHRRRRFGQCVLFDQPNHCSGPNAAGDCAPAAEPDEHPRWERQF